MKVEFINPFIEASQSVLSMLCGVDTKVGKVFLKGSTFTASDVLIIIGFVGKIKGQVCFELSNNTAKSIASCMMGGTPVDDFDDISKSAISEMSNMIMGNASIIFEENNINIDITPPSLFLGDNIEISNKSQTIVIPLDIDKYGSVMINITAENMAS